MTSEQENKCDFIIGNWRADVDRNQLQNRESHELRSIEPKLMDLLVLLAKANGHLVSRKKLIDSLWPNVVVGEDTLARTVSRLRRALGDSASNSQYIETIPKKGYALRFAPEIASMSENDLSSNSELSRDLPRLSTFSKASLVSFSVIALAAFLFYWFVYSAKSDPNLALLKRAEGYYMQFTERDNEAAISIYQRVLDSNPGSIVAQAGLANALVQRVVRWPKVSVIDHADKATLTQALNSGQLNNPEAELVLARAQAFAERAVRLAPQRTQALKSLGFVYSAQGKLSQAIDVYRQAISNDDMAWRSMINLGEIYLIQGAPEKALQQFTEAYSVMQQTYDNEPQHIGPWQPAVGVTVAQLHQQQGQLEQSETWYRRVLKLSPLEREATKGLASVLTLTGQVASAKQLCDSYREQLEELPGCLSDRN